MSVKSTRGGKVQRQYPPEVVVVDIRKNQTLPSSSSTTTTTTDLKYLLCPHLCTRILTVDDWPHPPSNDVEETFHATTDTSVTPTRASSWSKLRLFGLQQYDTILFLDADCLVMQDVSPLLDLSPSGMALTAAAPCKDSMDQFRTNVMVLSPSTTVFDDMALQYQQQEIFLSQSQSTIWDVDAFLNSYFSTWPEQFPSEACLAPRYNAPVSGFGSNKWKEELGSEETYILHFDTDTKPWEIPSSAEANENIGTNTPQSLYRALHMDSQYLVDGSLQKKKKKKTLQRKNVTAKRPPSTQSTSATVSVPTNSNDPRTIHQMIHHRFKHLRKQGLSMEDAMVQAREELQPQQQEAMDPASQVAAMFGMV
ncbi:glycosyl transferase family 8 protein [Nitzschia inconspicua]|uniref:Glycosyl transferase family 8 protein n=1 Tax=Nitzschia inconspicua TaxID=303405 RepID=A0A9K3PV11_9STRA|nr:glycosyl transferase family 8 protein [Nitzschia inconspicua]